MNRILCLAIVLCFGATGLLPSETAVANSLFETKKDAIWPANQHETAYQFRWFCLDTRDEVRWALDRALESSVQVDARLI